MCVWYEFATCGDGWWCFDTKKCERKKEESERVRVRMCVSVSCVCVGS